jgi:hypothetical protein
MLEHLRKRLAVVSLAKRGCEGRGAPTPTQNSALPGRLQPEHGPGRALRHDTGVQRRCASGARPIRHLARPLVGSGRRLDGGYDRRSRRCGWKGRRRSKAGSFGRQKLAKQSSSNVPQLPGAEPHRQNRAQRCELRQFGHRPPRPRPKRGLPSGRQGGSPVPDWQTRTRLLPWSIGQELAQTTEAPNEHGVLHSHYSEGTDDLRHTAALSVRRSEAEWQPGAPRSASARAVMTQPAHAASECGANA